MENLQAHNYGCQELDAVTAKEVNGGLDLPGTGGLGNILSPVTNLLTGLLGSTGLGNLLTPVSNIVNSLLSTLGLGKILGGL